MRYETRPDGDWICGLATRWKHGGFSLEFREKPLLIRVWIGEEIFEFSSLKSFYEALKIKSRAPLATYLKLVSDSPPSTPMLWEVLGAPKVGIDLAQKWSDINRIVLAGFGRSALKAGIEPEDLVQEVYRALLVRNNGKCPWDAAKSSFGHYVHLVASGTLVNLIARGRSKVLTVAAERVPDSVDCSQDPEQQATVARFVSSLKEHPLKPLAIKILPYVVEGRGIREIGDLVGVDRNKVSRAWEYLKDQTHLLR